MPEVSPLANPTWVIEAHTTIRRFLRWIVTTDPDLPLVGLVASVAQKLNHRLGTFITTEPFPTSYKVQALLDMLRLISKIPSENPRVQTLFDRVKIVARQALLPHIKIKMAGQSLFAHLLFENPEAARRSLALHALDPEGGDPQLSVVGEGIGGHAAKIIYFSSNLFFTCAFGYLTARVTAVFKGTYPFLVAVARAYAIHCMEEEYRTAMQVLDNTPHRGNNYVALSHETGIHPFFLSAFLYLYSWWLPAD